MALLDELIKRAKKQLKKTEADLAKLRKNPALSQVLTVNDLEEEVARRKRDLSRLEEQKAEGKP